MAVLFAAQASVAIENAKFYEAEKETREYLDLLIGSSQDGIIAVDNQGRVKRYSKGAGENSQIHPAGRPRETCG